MQWLDSKGDDFVKSFDIKDDKTDTYIVAPELIQIATSEM